MFANISVGTKNNQQLEYNDEDDFYSDNSDGESDMKGQAPPTGNLVSRMIMNFKNSMALALGRTPPGVTPKMDDLPEDYDVNPEYHEGKWYMGPTLAAFTVSYMAVCEQVKRLADEPWFSHAVIITIIIAGINVGVSTYACSEYDYRFQDNNPGGCMEEDKPLGQFFFYLDNVVWWIFFGEVLVKFFAGGIRPLRYFYGPEWKWNCFDFAVVMLDVPDYILPPFFAGSGSIALLRLVRLARLGKLVKKVPEIQMIIRGLLGGLSSIGYILLLLFLVFYLYAVVGFYLYHGNDPFHFGTLFLAITTLFRIATLANWGDIMYLNMFGCKGYPVYDYYDPADFRQFAKLSDDSEAIEAMDRYLEDDDYISNLEGGDAADDTRTDDFTINAEVMEGYGFYTSKRYNVWFYKCTDENNSEDQVIAPIYFISFVVISALVMLSLFIGAVTMSMTDSMDELKRLTEEKRRLVTFERNRQKIMNLMEVEKTEKGNEGEGTIAGKASVVGRERQLGRRSVVFMKQVVNRVSFGRAFSEEFNAPKDAAKEHADHKKRMKEALHHALGDVAWEERQRELEAQRAAGLAEIHWAWKNYEMFCDAMMTISVNDGFLNFVTLVIVLAGITVGAATDRRITQNDAFCSSLPPPPPAPFPSKKETDDEDEAAMCGTLELLEFIILIIFTLEVVVKLFAEKYHLLNYFSDHWNKFDFSIVVAGWATFLIGAGSEVAILRLLKLLRVLKLVKRFTKLAIIVNALIMGLASIGYVGIILFLTFYVFAILGIIMFGVNDPWHFGTLHDAMITLFRASTLDDWAELMYLQMYGCESFPEVYEDFPHMCTEESSTPNDVGALIYFTIFIVIAAQVLLTLFIGVISTSMDQARDDKKAEDELELELKKVAEERGLDETQIASFKVVFDMLDLDRGGTIEEEELMIGLSAIQSDMAPWEVQEILRKVDPDYNGVNLVGFINFMCLTPAYKDNAAAHKMLLLWNSKGKKKKKENWFTLWWNKFRKRFYSAAHNRQIQMEAALIIQSAWRSRLEYLMSRKRLSPEGERAYQAMEERLKRAEQEMIENEKAGMIGGVRHMDSLQVAVHDNMFEQQDDRAKYGHELHGENRAATSHGSPQS